MREHTSSKTHFEELACPDSIQTCPNSQILSDCFPVAGCRVKGKHVHARGWWRLRYRSQPNIARQTIIIGYGANLGDRNEAQQNDANRKEDANRNDARSLPDGTTASLRPIQTPASPAPNLNQFTEMVKLIEQLPDTPELIGDLLNWHPTTYQDYFNASAMPGRVSAADVYASLNRCVRQNFEGVVDDLDRKAIGAVAVIRRHYKTHGEARPDIMTDICARAGTHLREVIGKANDLVSPVPGTAGNFAQRRKLRVSQA